MMCKNVMIVMCTYVMIMMCKNVTIIIVMQQIMIMLCALILVCFSRYQALQRAVKASRLETPKKASGISAPTGVVKVSANLFISKIDKL